MTGAQQSAGDPWALVTAVQAGDRDAYGHLWERYAPGVNRYIRSRLLNPHTAEDLTSETFLRGLRRIDSVTDQGKDPQAWFTQIAKNLVLDHVKSSDHQRSTLTADLGDGRSGQRTPEDEAVANDETTRLWGHVSRLTEPQQRVIELGFDQDLTIAETALTVGRAVGAVKSLRHRAFNRLAELIVADNDNPTTKDTAVSTAEQFDEAIADLDVPVQGDPDRREQLNRWHTDDHAAGTAQDTEVAS